MLAADQFLDGEFRVLHGEGSERDESVREPPHCVPQVVVNQLRQVQDVRAFRLQKKKGIKRKNFEAVRAPSSI